MMKIFFSLIIGIFLTCAVIAQNNFDKFIGDWKLTKVSNIKDLKFETQLNVSVTSDILKIEKTSIEANKTYVQPTELFNKNGKTTTSVSKRGNCGSESKYLLSSNLNNLYIERKANDILNPNRIFYDIERWSLSNDGKTLTIQMTFKVLDNSGTPINQDPFALGSVTKFIYSKT